MYLTVFLLLEGVHAHQPDIPRLKGLKDLVKINESKTTSSGDKKTAS